MNDGVLGLLLDAGRSLRILLKRFGLVKNCLVRSESDCGGQAARPHATHAFEPKSVFCVVQFLLLQACRRMFFSGFDSFRHAATRRKLHGVLMKVSDRCFILIELKVSYRIPSPLFFLRRW